MNLSLIESLKKSIEGKNIKIVLPEGEDGRILKAAVKLKREKVLFPILLGNKEQIIKEANKLSLGAEIEEIEIRDPENDPKFDEYVEAFIELRNGKNTKEQAEQMLKDVNYFGTMMVQLGEADGMVSGAIHTTGDTVRPALQIIKTKPGVSRTSGAMVMLGKQGEKYLFADIAINTTLDAQQLGEIAVISSQTAKVFGIDPKVALLSFSTNGSAVTPESQKVAEAAKIAKQIVEEQGLDVPIDGEMQFDAAVSSTVADLKFPSSNVAGYANTFIFPTLEAGNIGYKIAQRLGGYTAVGPILQGLKKPVNDLSRGCNSEDVYLTSIVTAAQSLQ
ncbi:phosphate acetyltransferase [Helcococcus ovis]|uniref:Phosphate acetyltransferase n=2 Tax=Bacteria TaxID=2 RepID=A0A4R9C365_9FIRM|nr:phosphate acetyltransferase [Helcococcus ovis]TFF65359.1 phosphate acetyltransferase [Helcococcus ovis]TFF67684.1 phosphate acetyltransferase [Helcococcus ovis]TFF68745.1 phosphate acetyltransferase [Helcococcus ovis]WNZ01238.1 phosphate acetyltransferase [Helcococcus ovis]